MVWFLSLLFVLHCLLHFFFLSFYSFLLSFTPFLTVTDHCFHLHFPQAPLVWTEKGGTGESNCEWKRPRITAVISPTSLISPLSQFSSSSSIPQLLSPTPSYRPPGPLSPTSPFPTITPSPFSPQQPLPSAQRHIPDSPMEPAFFFFFSLEWVNCFIESSSDKFQVAWDVLLVATCLDVTTTGGLRPAIL